MTNVPVDHLADLIPPSASASDIASRWGERFMKVTLLLVFFDIAFVVLFLLEQSSIIAFQKVGVLIEYWTHPAIATIAALGATCVSGIFKLSYDITR